MKRSLSLETDDRYYPIGFAMTKIVLFSLAFSLTVIPSTIAKQLDPVNNSYQTIKSPTPQQLLERGEAFDEAGRFAEAVTVLQQAVRISQRSGDRLRQAAALTKINDYQILLI